MTSSGPTEMANPILESQNNFMESVFSLKVVQCEEIIKNHDHRDFQDFRYIGHENLRAIFLLPFFAIFFSEMFFQHKNTSFSQVASRIQDHHISTAHPYV